MKTEEQKGNRVDLLECKFRKNQVVKVNTGFYKGTKGELIRVSAKSEEGDIIYTLKPFTIKDKKRVYSETILVGEDNIKALNFFEDLRT